MSLPVPPGKNGALIHLPGDIDQKGHEFYVPGTQPHILVTQSTVLHRFTIGGQALTLSRTPMAQGDCDYAISGVNEVLQPHLQRMMSPLPGYVATLNGERLESSAEAGNTASFEQCRKQLALLQDVYRSVSDFPKARPATDDFFGKIKKRRALSSEALAGADSAISTLQRFKRQEGATSEDRGLLYIPEKVDRELG